MMFSSRVRAHCLCRRPVRVRPPIQMIARGQVGLQLSSLRSYANRQPEDERIYVMGTGTQANLFAYSLAQKPLPPPITLLWKHAYTMQSWEKFGKCIEIVKDGVSDKQHAFDTEACLHDDGSVLVGGDLIRNVIICTKDAFARKAISKIKHRLNEKSTIFFPQPCMGVIEEVSELVFPDTDSRPNFVGGIMGHFIYRKSKFATIYRGTGSVTIGVLPHGSLVDAPKNKSDSTPPAEPSRYLIQQILDTPFLVGKEVSTQEFIQTKMEKLVWGAMTRPMKVIFGRRNEKIPQLSKIQSLVRLLLYEASRVLQALPELQKDPGSATRFSPEELEQRLMEATKTYWITEPGSRRPAFAGLPENDIDYLNGYIVKRGEQLGIDCPHNRTLVKMVKEDRVINESQIDEFFPQ